LAVGASQQQAARIHPEADPANGCQPAKGYAGPRYGPLERVTAGRPAPIWVVARVRPLVPVIGDGGFVFIGFQLYLVEVQPVVIVVRAQESS
jgi:hypothetical protein